MYSIFVKLAQFHDFPILINRFDTAQILVRIGQDYANYGDIHSAATKLSPRNLALYLPSSAHPLRVSAHREVGRRPRTGRALDMGLFTGPTTKAPRSGCLLMLVLGKTSDC